MCYTSGTTGDAKGVKLTHSNLLHDVESFMEKVSTDAGTVMISYLPYPHVFEQALMGAIMACGGKIGYFNGNPATLTEDCAMLKPTVFTSVPRLYNKIHSKISA
jgi:long-chain acyl-CoA synthetase